MDLTGHNLQRRRVLKDLNLSRPDIEEFSKEFKDQISLTKQVRDQNNLDPNTFVPEVSHGRTCFALRAFCLRNQCEFTARRFAPGPKKLVKSFTVIKACSKFKGLASARRLKVREQARAKRNDAVMDAALSGETEGQKNAVTLVSKPHARSVAGVLFHLRSGPRSNPRACLSPCSASRAAQLPSSFASVSLFRAAPRRRPRLSRRRRRCKR